MHPDGSVSNWLSRHPAVDGPVILALDETERRLTVSGPRAAAHGRDHAGCPRLRLDAWGRCRPVRDGREGVMPFDALEAATVRPPAPPRFGMVLLLLTLAAPAHAQPVQGASPPGARACVTAVRPPERQLGIRPARSCGLRCLRRTLLGSSSPPTFRAS
jgi:hypothetical protein